MTRTKSAGAFVCFVLRCDLIQSQTLTPGQPDDPQSLQWPRFYATYGYEFAVYQPCISTWPGNQLGGRFVLAVRPEGTSNETYGDIEKAIVQQVKNDPPRIIYTTQPSLLVLVDGAPIQKPLIGDYERVVNTRPVVPWNKGLAWPGYYLFAAERWYAAPSLDGPWTVSLSPPADIRPALDAAIAAKEVDLLPPKDPAVLPAVLHIYVSTVPAELLETQGAPNLLAISGTDLLHVANSGSAIFFFLDDSQYYILISGRWFKSASLYGPWAFVPPGGLPADFQRIPPDHEKSNVLASAPGTPEAREAVIASSIPQTATMERAEAKLTVVYAGAPSFIGIPGTPLSYAVNTATPVVRVDEKTYYACEGGAWFVAASSLGPWAAATEVPDVIYTIPVSCPIHYVAYAYVYGDSPSVDRGVAGNTRTGNSVAWNNGNMYADKNGSMYRYSQSSGAQKYNTASDSWQSVSKPTFRSYSSAQSSCANRSWGGSSSWADRAGSALSFGSDRFSSWSRSGGDGWGGFRGGGGFRR